MKERIISIFILLLAALTVCLIVIDLPKKNYAMPASDFTEAVRNGTPPVADEVIRLHILADSDSKEDQNVKLALRDVLLPHLNEATLNAKNKSDAMVCLTNQCKALTEVANSFLKEQNTGYTATISVERVYFPIRIYGSQTYLSTDAVIFPPGYYDSVQVVLGSGKGHNWWCLAYPSLCSIDSAYDYIPKDSDIYKIKIGSSSKSSLEKLFFGAMLSTHNSTDTCVSDTGSDEITLYFGSKLWEIIRNLLKPVD